MTDTKAAYEQPFLSTSIRAAMPRVMQGMCVIAAVIDIAYLAFFLFIDAPWLAWINLLSVALYGAAYRMLRKRRMRAAVLLIWLEAFAHAVYGTLLIGWASGFHYMLLMFVPAVVITSRRREGMLFIASLLVFLLALYSVAYQIGPLMPINAKALDFLGLANFVLFVMMFSWSTDYYRGQLLHAERQLQEQATTDALTGLSNRRHFNVLAARALHQSERSQQPTCVAILDIDHFKPINDTHGHKAGDLALVAVAGLLTANIRKYDLLARWGGEEFVLLMPNTDMAGARDVLERIRAQLQETSIHLPRQAIRLTISIGVAQLAPAESLASGLNRADEALYRSKSEGRNRVCVG